MKFVVLSRQSENVTLGQSRNLTLTAAGWRSAGRAATDEPDGKEPVGDVAEDQEETDHATGAGAGTGSHYPAREAAAEGAEEARRPGSDSRVARAAKRK